MKNIKSMLMVSLLVCGQGLVASENSLTSVSTNGDTVVASTQSIGSDVHITDLALAAIAVELGIQMTKMVYSNMNLSESVGKSGEVGISALTVLGACMGGCAMGDMGPMESVVPCALYATLFTAQVEIEKLVNSK